ncbi:hypothetical protein EB796_005084 [Bugula neritina]|uniref:Uncharacterized protein n=1 Tax=Bugula neritina TaxID=10212 RepID=A0A7J7KEF3_BUGNE|nr:hypothetical protein EB796_005084 [Bugula neritina]
MASRWTLCLLGFIVGDRCNRSGYCGDCAPGHYCHNSKCRKVTDTEAPVARRPTRPIPTTASTTGAPTTAAPTTAAPTTAAPTTVAPTTAAPTTAAPTTVAPTTAAPTTAAPTTAAPTTAAPTTAAPTTAAPTTVAPPTRAPTIVITQTGKGSKCKTRCQPGYCCVKTTTKSRFINFWKTVLDWERYKCAAGNSEVRVNEIYNEMNSLISKNKWEKQSQ